jgi:tRNA dimethylallyltransferase
VSEPLLVAVLGPTASGKSALAVNLAQRFNGEIVNCDSVALYREFDIGTAKPSREERAAVSHHLFDIAEATQAVTAGDYSRMSRDAVREISAREKLPIVAGGTGLYLRALLEGLFAGPQRSEPLRARLRELARTRREGHLSRVLHRLDPNSAVAIHGNDTPKLIRAIEVCLRARGRMSELWKSGRDPLQGFRVLRLGLDPERKALYARIDLRAGKMFEAGLIEETQVLLDEYGDDAQPLSSLGYRQARMFLRGELTREQAIAAAQQGHRNYAKRQMTWFRREPGVFWLEGFGDDGEIQRLAAEKVHRLLGDRESVGKPA